MTLKVTNVTAFPSKGGIGKFNGVVTLNDALELKYSILNMGKGDFIVFKGSEKYQNKEGKTAYSHAIYFKDEETDKRVKEAILAKTGSSKKEDERSSPIVDDFTSDDIPF